MKKIVISYSGGLDSYILYHICKQQNPTANIVCVYWDFGQEVAKQEVPRLPDFVEVRKLDWLNLKGKTPLGLKGRNEGNIFIAGRNLVLATLLACEELAHEIWLGALYGENHNKGTDKNDQFLWQTNSTLNYVLSPFYDKEEKLVVRFPLVEMKLNKKDLTIWALSNGITQEELKKTYSCHKGKDKQCGECVQCVKRWAVFGSLGFYEVYDNNPKESDMARAMYVEMKRTLDGGENPYYNQESINEVYDYLKTQF